MRHHQLLLARRAATSVGTAPCGPTRRSMGALLALVLAALLLLVPAGQRLAQAAEAATTLTFYTDDDKGVYFSAEGGSVAYCLDPDVPGPGKTGSTYTRLERATGVVGYLAYHGYPNNLTIGGVSFPNTTIGTKNARVTTNMAIWTYQRDHTRTTVTDCGLDSMNQAATKLLTDAQAWAKSSANNAKAPENNSTWIYQPPSGSGKQRMLLPGKFEEPEEEKGSLTLTKVSSNSAVSSENGCYSLAGATYEVFSDKALSKSVGTLTTTEDGTANALGDLAAGTYYVKETKAPLGFVLDSTVHEATVKAGSSCVVTLEDAPIYDQPSVLLEKRDAQTGQAAPQGDGSLAGAQFSVRYWDNTEGDTSGSPKLSWVLQTDASGRVLFDDEHLVSGDAFIRDASGTPVMPLGTIGIAETTAPEGYLVASQGERVQVLKAEGGSLAAPFEVTQVDEEAVRGGVVVGKISQESASHLAQGQSSLEGACFSITLLSPGSVVVGDQTYTTGQTVMTITSAWEGDACVARTGERDLPYGTYELREASVAPGSGTALNQQWSQVVQIREDGAYVDLTATDLACPNRVVRGDLAFVKRNAQTAEAMAGVPFVLQSQSTGETHVIVTDENGQFDSSAFPHTQATNANDAALGGDGSVEESMLDANSGVWFSGRADLVVEASDSAGALPYDTYLLRELPCSANEGMQLVEVSVSVRRDAQTIDWGTIDNQPLPKVTILTELVADTGGHEVGNRNATLTDAVSYDGLTLGARYTLVGTLHLRSADGEDAGILSDADGDPCTQSLSFDARSVSGTIELPFEVDASALAGQTVVCFEELYEGEGGDEPLATHADIADADQSVRIVGLATTATGTDGSKELAANSGATVTDVVRYEGLTPGNRYVIAGSLHLRSADGSDLGAVADAGGVAVTATCELVPTDASGEAVLTFSFDATSLDSCTLVAFEQLQDAQGAVIATHEDIGDEAQTVRVPSVSTTAVDSLTMGHLAPAEGIRTIVDTVTYQNLTPGDTYILTGTLHGRAEDGSDAGELAGTEEAPASAQVSFVPEEPDGSIDLTIDLDTKELKTPQVVVFEQLSRQETGAVVATHADIDAASQTIGFPSITTTLTDAKDGDHEISQGATTVIDEVTYQGLVPGIEYRVAGTIHVKASDGSDDGPLKDSSGHEVSAEATFTPQTPDGSVCLEFSFDASLLDGRPAVAFEVLYQAEARIAAHEDIGDQKQTVTPASEPVKPATTTTQGRTDTTLRMPQTGRFPMAVALAGAGSALTTVGIVTLATQRRRQAAGPRPRRRRHYIR